MSEQPTTEDLHEQLRMQFDPETDDKPDALGPEDINDDGEVVER